MMATKWDINRSSEGELGVGIIAVEDRGHVKAVTPVVCGGSVTETEF